MPNPNWSTFENAQTDLLTEIRDQLATLVERFPQNMTQEFQNLSDAIAKVQTDVGNVQTMVSGLKDQITALEGQIAAGNPITPEQVAALTTQVDAIDAALDAVAPDAAVPTEPPAEPTP